MIAILSDSHNNLANLRAALNIVLEAGVTTIIHCGDLTSPDTARLLHDFRVIYTFGNVDTLTGAIQAVLKSLNPDNYAGLSYSGEIDGVPLAVTHGHLPGKLEELVEAGRYAYVFHGHSHRHKDAQVGATRVINPGALGGLHLEPRQICLLDLASGKADFIQVEAGV